MGLACSNLNDDLCNDNACVKKLKTRRVKLWSIKACHLLNNLDILPFIATAVERTEKALGLLEGEEIVGEEIPEQYYAN